MEEKTLAQNSDEFETLVQNSDEFETKTKIKFPVQTNRIKNLKEKKDYILTCARETRVLIHSDVKKKLIPDWLTVKQNYGTEIEKNFYKTFDPTKESDILKFINRLVAKRPIVFMTRFDQFTARDGLGNVGGFEKIGTPNEKSPLNIQEYMSYDEIQISG